MTTMSSERSRRRLDPAGLALLVVGVVFGVIAYILVTSQDMNPVLLVPSVVAATIGSSHLFKWEAGRD